MNGFKQYFIARSFHFEPLCIKDVILNSCDIDIVLLLWFVHKKNIMDQKQNTLSLRLSGQRKLKVARNNFHSLVSHLIVLFNLNNALEKIAATSMFRCEGHIHA